MSACSHGEGKCSSRQFNYWMSALLGLQNLFFLLSGELNNVVKGIRVSLDD